MPDVLALIPEQHPYQNTDGYWIGRLSTLVGEASKDADKFWQQHFTAALRELLASPVVQSPDLRETLRRYL